VQRFSVISFTGFHDVVAEFEAAIGHPDMNSFSKNVAAALRGMMLLLKSVIQ
jgi:hypothetical protein